MISSRSVGVKLIVVSGLAVAMTIPAVFISGIVEERTARGADVVRQISAASGGQQTFLGPILVIRYKKRTGPRDAYVVFPTSGSAVLKTATEERRRSLFRVPVFRVDVRFDAAFDLSGTPSALPPGAELDWDGAEIVLGVSDVHGALEDATVTMDGVTSTVAPTQTFTNVTTGTDKTKLLHLALLGTKAGAVVKPNARFTLTSAMRFSGAQRVAVLAYGKKTQVSAQGDWPDPGFDGAFLPIRRTVSQSGYSAEWSVPYVARGIAAEGPVDNVLGIETTALGTSFVQLADPYQSVNRSLKYVLLFLGLVFLSYFVLEVSAGRRVHPAQYILVGVAQLIFYLLLLSVAERIGFDWAFLLAGAATIGLLATNAAWVFGRRQEGLRALATFTPLYSLIYFMLRAEDYALLIGAVASFLAVATTMRLTRRIDWYSAAPRPYNS